MKAEVQNKVLRTLKKESFLAPTLSRADHGIFEQLIQHETHIGLIGLGPEGRALGLEFSQEIEVIGFDENSVLVNETRSTIKAVLSKIPTGTLIPHISFSESASALKEAKVYMINIDNEINDSNEPVLTTLKNMTKLVASMMKTGDTIIYTSSMYPGCTEEMCIPMLESESGLRLNLDFKVAYVPLRCTHNKHGLKVVVPMIISGSDKHTCQEMSKLFGHFNFSSTFIAPSIRVAEAARLVIHAQRDVNIALMNEFSIIFNASGIESREVMDAAASQEDFIPFEPGLVGGTSTGLDSYYLMHHARKNGVDAELIRSSRMVNDWMPFEMVKRCEAALESIGKNIENARILVKGISYRENVRDVRNSKAVELCKIFELKGAKVDIQDPVANPEALKRLYGLSLQRKVKEQYDLVVIAVKHSAFRGECVISLRPLFKDRPVLCDIGNIVKHVDADVIKVAL